MTIIEALAERFVRDGLPDDVPEITRQVAVQLVLDAVGFDAAVVMPSQGDLSLAYCEGEDGREASEWLRALIDEIYRRDPGGRIPHVCAAISAQVVSRN